MRPCVRCLNPKIVRKRVGQNRSFCVIQCASECGFNVTAANFKQAESLWNGFRVWELVDKRPRFYLSVWKKD